MEHLIKKLHHSEYRQGRCGKCKIRFTWPVNAGLKVGDSSCPLCQEFLIRTVHAALMPVQQCRVNASVTDSGTHLHLIPDGPRYPGPSAYAKREQQCRDCKLYELRKRWGTDEEYYYCVMFNSPMPPGHGCKHHKQKGE